MSSKQKFTASVRDFFLRLDCAGGYDNTGLTLGWHLQVQISGGNYATFNVIGREFPASIVNNVISNGWYLCECAEGYFGSAESFEDNPDKVIAFLQARREGYKGRPINRTKYIVKAA